MYKRERIKRMNAYVYTCDNGTQFLMSYQTIVAMRVGDQYFRTDKYHSKTTQIHVNTWCKPPCDTVAESTIRAEARRLGIG